MLDGVHELELDYRIEHKTSLRVRSRDALPRLMALRGALRFGTGGSVRSALCALFPQTGPSLFARIPCTLRIRQVFRLESLASGRLPARLIASSQWQSDQSPTHYGGASAVEFPESWRLHYAESWDRGHHTSLFARRSPGAEPRRTPDAPAIVTGALPTSNALAAARLTTVRWTRYTGTWTSRWKVTPSACAALGATVGSASAPRRSREAGANPARARRCNRGRPSK